MQPFRFFFHYSKEQRKGIIVLLLLIVIIQSLYFVVNAYNWQSDTAQSAEAKAWLAVQTRIDSLKERKAKYKPRIYRFNPNYLTDYRGYVLGMSTAEIDRMHAFRKTNKYVNTVEEFQEVTQVSDSLLKTIAPYLKFPDWLKHRKDNKEIEIYPFNPNYISDFKAKLIGLSKKELSRIRKFRASGKWVNSAKEFQEVTKVSDSLLKTIEPYFKFPDWVVEKNARNRISENKTSQGVIDINKATAKQLRTVHGIGAAFSKRILQRRKQLGGYVSMEQMDDFDKLSNRVKTELKQRFVVVGEPKISTININKASLNTLANFPYFNNAIAKAIIAKRTKKGRINNIVELTEINEFPLQKEKIIALYLEF